MLPIQNITMKACARVVVIEANCHVSSQCQLGGLTAVGSLPHFNFTSLTALTTLVFTHVNFFYEKGKVKANVYTTQ